MRRERELMQRELDLARRENELLRNTPRSEASIRMPSNATLKSICDYLCEFHGTEDMGKRNQEIAYHTQSR